MENFLIFFGIIGFLLLVVWAARTDNRNFQNEQAIELRKQKAEQEAAKAAKPAEEAQERARNALIQKYETALNFSTYELAEIVINLVDLNSYDKLKDVASVLTDPAYVDEVLTDASKMLSDGYESALKEIASTRCTGINYKEESVAKKLATLVDSCEAIGRGAIGKKIGLTVGTADSSVSKGTIRKTKKWEN